MPSLELHFTNVELTVRGLKSLQLIIFVANTYLDIRLRTLPSKRDVKHSVLMPIEVIGTETNGLWRLGDVGQVHYMRGICEITGRSHLNLIVCC